MGMSASGRGERPARSSTAIRRAGAALAGVALLCGGRPAAALAHDDAPLAPHDLAGAWHWDPAVLLGLALAGWLYARGARALWRRAGPGGGLRRRQAAAFAGGLATLVVALVSPLDALGATLFAAHMAQHLILILVAAPLLVAGAPHVPFLWALPLPARRALGGRWRRATAPRAAWRVLTRPPVAALLHAAAVWVWHLPGPYQAALRSDLIHAAEHGSFLGTALLFWWTLARAGARDRPGQGAGLFAVFALAVQGGVLGALITFAPTPWYPIHAPRVGAWGLTPLEDQQLAGLIMWVPAGLAYALVAAALFVAWLRAVDRDVRRRELRPGARALAE